MSTQKTVKKAQNPPLSKGAVSGSTLIREDCRFRDAPCNYTGKGWYDRCAWCKDNNGFRNKNEDNSKPF